jgi:transposase-like protein
MDKQEKQPCRNQAQAKIHEHQKETDKTRVKRNGKEVSFDFKISVIDEINNGQISAHYASKKYNISRSTIAYWRKKLSNFQSKDKNMNKDAEIKKLKERIEALEFIKDFQQDMIIEFEKETGLELSKKYLPESR